MKEIKKIIVVGGGSAGYMSALTLQRKFDNLVVYESPNVPVIKVGESTTGGLRSFLHGVLGLDRVEFQKEVSVTTKLVARFDFGPDHTPWWDYSLGSALKFFIPSERLPVFYIHKSGKFDQSTINSVLFNESIDVVRPDGHSGFGHGYHFDNETFIAYLKKVFVRRGGRIEYKTVKDAKTNEDGIEELIFDDSTTDTADLYIDCTGFKSLLLGNKLEVPFIDYSDRLLCNAALVTSYKREGPPILGTVAEKMKYGWIWTIDHNDKRMRGYVHCDKFVSEDEIRVELAEKISVPHEEPRKVRFSSGHRVAAWEKNVIGIGNSFAFIEPMEATALHHSADQIVSLMDLLSLNPHISDRTRNIYNDMQNMMCEDIREFIELHYIAATGLDTPFWHHFKDLEPTGTTRRVCEWYKNMGPQVLEDNRFTNHIFRSTDPFRWIGYFSVLMGCHYPTDWVNPTSDEEMIKWDENNEMMLKIAREKGWL